MANEEGYCVKCKSKCEMKDATTKTAKNGRHMLQGTCTVCGTKMTKFISKSD